ncbi:peptidylprolyl isomerase [Calycomorphotria hydatis]|uniref:peptidylprolyl isomerase n=1 Tax=Calycomorphotria hydatis TaxID=2528027 RepID=UPI0018D24DC6|nr:peptidyl-prolyl cis-trans isomerase [Calycomorphotria hydatis]
MSSEILTVSATEREIDDHTVVATVNAEPILAGEILTPYAGNLKKAAQEMSPTQLDTVKKTLIKRDLDRHVERHVLMQAVRNTMKAEEIEQIQEALDMAFSDEVEKIKAKAGVATRAELGPHLAKDGLTLEAIEQMFKDQQMALVYVAQNSNFETPSVGRAEIVDYYTDHLDDYTHDAKARWQQIVIRIDRVGKAKAQEIAGQVVTDLKARRSFADIAREVSHGPRADRGGQWDWTTPGSLSDKKIDTAIFELPVKAVGGPFEDEKTIRFIRVTERVEAGTTSLTEVQDEIRGKLLQEQNRVASRKVIEDLLADAVVETQLN